jgi:predicted nucleic acid-binding protein
VPNSFIVNASPLILLSGIGGTDWIGRISTAPTIIPQAVIEEINAGPGGANLVRSLEDDSRFEIRNNIPVSSMIEAWSLGAGESQVLAMSERETRAVALLDDNAARQCALSMHIEVVGTLAIVLTAKRRGWIPAARPVIEDLVARRMYVSADLIAAALREVGE